MPDLSHEAALKYWFEFIDPMIYRVIVFLESVEDWTLDGNPELEAVITELGKQLDDIREIDMYNLGHAERFIQLLANIKSGRGLRLLQAIDTEHPGSASKVLMYAEENTLSSLDPAGFFLKRNIVFERLRLLSRVFSEQRLRLVAKALEGDE
jgi:intracellular multiplication protein IcmW